MLPVPECVVLRKHTQHLRVGYQNASETKSYSTLSLPPHQVKHVRVGTVPRSVVSLGPHHQVFARVVQPRLFSCRKESVRVVVHLRASPPPTLWVAPLPLLLLALSVVRNRCMGWRMSIQQQQRQQQQRESFNLDP